MPSQFLRKTWNRAAIPLPKKPLTHHGLQHIQQGNCWATITQKSTLWQRRQRAGNTLKLYFQGWSNYVVQWTPYFRGQTGWGWHQKRGSTAMILTAKLLPPKGVKVGLDSRKWWGACWRWRKWFGVHAGEHMLAGVRSGYEHVWHCVAEFGDGFSLDHSLVFFNPMLCKKYQLQCYGV